MHGTSAVGFTYYDTDYKHFVMYHRHPIDELRVYTKSSNSSYLAPKYSKVIQRSTATDIVENLA